MEFSEIIKELRGMNADVRRARKEFESRHDGKMPLKRIDDKLTDIFALLYVEFYVRGRKK